MKLACTAHLGVAVVWAVVGLVYLTRSEFLSFHADAVGRAWGGVEPAFQVLILALMRALGGAWLAVAVAIAILLAIPFRRGERWARWAIPAVGLTSSSAALWATTFVARHSPAQPPYGAVAFGIVMLLVGLALSLERRPGGRG